MAKFLFLLTMHGRYNELKYGSCVARNIAEKVKELGHDVIIVIRPSPQIANNVIKQHKPDIVWWIGHGNPTTTTLENIQIWIKAPNYNVDILNGVVACALSCLTGLYLGKYVTKNEKCISYLGYISEFWFVWCGKDFDCSCSGKNPYGIKEEIWKKIVMCPHESNLYFVLGLAKGFTSYDAYKYSINRFNYWINYFENIKPESNKEMSVLRVILWILKHNRDSTVLYGSKEYKVKKEETKKSKMSVGILSIILALGSLFSYISHKKQEVKE